MPGALRADVNPRHVKHVKHVKRAARSWGCGCRRWPAGTGGGHLTTTVREEAYTESLVRG